MTSAMRKLAARHSLDPAAAYLIRLTNNAVFALPAAGVVIRIARSHSLGDRVAKGVELAGWFERINAPTIRLAGPAHQPLEVDVLHATVWRYIPPGAPLTASHLGAALREFHALGLAPFPLPTWNPVADARRRLADAEALADDERQMLQQWCDRLEPQLAALMLRQAPGLVHGDAHVGNLLRDGDRVVFCDFDASCAGPWQADLAALTVAEQRFGRAGLHRQLAESYGYDVLDDPAWPLLRSARELKMVVAAVPLLSSAPGVREEFRLRLETIITDDHVTRWTPFADL